MSWRRESGTQSWLLQSRPGGSYLTSGHVVSLSVKEESRFPPFWAVVQLDLFRRGLNTEVKERFQSLGMSARLLSWSLPAWG